jgi:3-oxoacyl-[acyl-carrier protein] reductase
LKLTGKNIIVTGGSQGLGKEIAKHCLTEGASVSICARDKSALDQVYDELIAYKQHHETLSVFVADISNKQEADAFVEYAVLQTQSLNVLINNAGIHGSKNTIDDPGFDLQGWIEAVRVNLFGTLNMCRAAIPYLKKNSFGKIINLSGGGATSPMPGMSAYAASKAALVRFTETVAMELREFNIDVNAIAPGAMNTRLLDDVLINGKGKVTADYYEKALKQKESGGTPLSKAAELCVYLASDESNGVTGKLISAVWDDWSHLHEHLTELDSDVYTLRRIVL